MIKVDKIPGTEMAEIMSQSEKNQKNVSIFSSISFLHLRYDEGGNTFKWREYNKKG